MNLRAVIPECKWALKTSLSGEGPVCLFTVDTGITKNTYCSWNYCIFFQYRRPWGCALGIAVLVKLMRNLQVREVYSFVFPFPAVAIILTVCGWNERGGVRCAHSRRGQSPMSRGRDAGRLSTGGVGYCSPPAGRRLPLLPREE